MQEKDDSENITSTRQKRDFSSNRLRQCIERQIDLYKPNKYINLQPNKNVWNSCNSL